MEVELIIDGENVVINDFVQKIFGSIVGGAVEALHGVNSDWGDVSLKIKK